MVFPVVMYVCKSWTIKKAEHQRIDAFELWCWRRLLRVPWTARRSNQSILKQISPGCSSEGLMLKLKLQYFGHLMRRTDWQRLRAGGEGYDRGCDCWMASLTQWTWVWVDSGSWWWTGRPGVWQFMGSQSVEPDWATELNWKCWVLRHSTSECLETEFLKRWQIKIRSLEWVLIQCDWFPYKKRRFGPRQAYIWKKGQAVYGLKEKVAVCKARKRPQKKSDLLSSRTVRK